MLLDMQPQLQLQLQQQLQQQLLMYRMQPLPQLPHQQHPLFLDQMQRRGVDADNRVHFGHLIRRRAPIRAARRPILDKRVHAGCGKIGRGMPELE